MSNDKNDAIRIHGARQNNLRNLDLEIPLNELIVVTGVSGSGKSSLVFDTLYAEGQRRYVETFSPYARQFLDRMDKPAVDRIEGIPPAIAIDQTNPVRTSRSTVGTMTELNDHIKLLYARAGHLHCRACGKPVRRDTPESICDDLIAGKASIRETVVFSEQAEISLEEDKAEEYMRWTLEGMESIRGHFAVALKTWNQLIAEQAKADGKKSKKLLTLKRKTARLRLEIAQEIKHLNLTERSRQVLIASIRKVVEEPFTWLAGDPLDPFRLATHLVRIYEDAPADSLPPNHFVIAVSPEDYAEVADGRGSELELQVADYVALLAERRGLHISEAPTVTFEADDGELPRRARIVAGRRAEQPDVHTEVFTLDPGDAVRTRATRTRRSRS